MDQLIDEEFNKKNPDYEILQIYIEDKIPVDHNNYIHKIKTMLGYKTKQHLQCEKIFKKLNLDCKECNLYY